MYLIISILPQAPNKMQMPRKYLFDEKKSCQHKQIITATSCAPAVDLSWRVLISLFRQRQLLDLTSLATRFHYCSTNRIISIILNKWIRNSNSLKKAVVGAPSSIVVIPQTSRSDMGFLLVYDSKPGYSRRGSGPGWVTRKFVIFYQKFVPHLYLLLW